MREKKAAYPPINIGTSFMLVIFILLCMVIFAVLSLSSALKDYDYAVQKADRTKAYYEACNEAEEIYAKIEAENHTEDSIEYSVAISEKEHLQVTLKRRSDTENNYYIDSWLQISTQEWTADHTLPVLGSH
jgi:hypothetical protein